MALPNRSRAWRTSITSVTGSATSTQTFSLGSVNGRPTLPFTAAVVKRGQDANPGTHEEITITAMTGSAVTACTRAANTTSAIALEVGDSVYASVSALLDAYEATISGAFVVDGVSYPATRAGVQAAVTAAAVSGGVVDVAVTVTFDTTTVTQPAAGNVTIRCRPGVRLKAPASGACIMFTPSGTATATSTLSANATRGALTFAHNQTGGLTFAAGEYFLLHNPAAGKLFGHAGRVETVSGSAPQTVTISGTIPETFSTANGCTVQRITPIPNLRFENCYFDNNGNTAAVIAVAPSVMLDMAFENTIFDGFKGSGVGSADAAGAVASNYTLRTSYKGVRFIDCGTRGLAALQMYEGTQTLYDHVTFTGGGFSLNHLGSSFGTLRSVKSNYANGRAIAIGGASATPSFETTLIDVQADHALQGEIGIGFRGGSAYATLHGCGGRGTEGAGFWTEGFGEHDIRDFGGEYINNNTLGLSADIAVSATCYNFEFRGTKYGTKSDLGVGTRFNDALIVTTGSSVVNNNTEQITLSYTVKGGLLTLYNALRLTFQGIIDNNAGNRTIAVAVKYGGTTLWKDTTPNIAASGGASVYRPFAMEVILRNVAATNVQAMTGNLVIGGVPATTGFGDLAAAGSLPTAPFYGTAAEVSTGDLAFVITVTMSANDFSFVPVNTLIETVG